MIAVRQSKKALRTNIREQEDWMIKNINHPAWEQKALERNINLVHLARLEKSNQVNTYIDTRPEPKVRTIN